MNTENAKSLRPAYVRYVTAALVALLLWVGYVRWSEYREVVESGFFAKDLETSSSLRESVELYRMRAAPGVLNPALDFHDVDKVLSRLVGDGFLAEKDAAYFREHRSRFVITLEKGGPNFEVKQAAEDFKKVRF